MKKIKSIRHLQAEKRLVRQHQEVLEHRMRNNWDDLKECLKPANIARDAINTLMRRKTERNLDSGNVLNSTFTFGVTLFAKKIAEKAGEKLGRLFRK